MRIPRHAGRGRAIPGSALARPRKEPCHNLLINRELCGLPKLINEAFALRRLPESAKGHTRLAQGQWGESSRRTPRQLAYQAVYLGILVIVGGFIHWKMSRETGSRFRCFALGRNGQWLPVRARVGSGQLYRITKLLLPPIDRFSIGIDDDNQCGFRAHRSRAVSFDVFGVVASYPLFARTAKWKWC